jgi:hypothetical protein
MVLRALLDDWRCSVISPKLLTLFLFVLMVGCAALTGCAGFVDDYDRHACATGKEQGAKCIAFQKGGTAS